ncbi:hypothetical protein POTOM_027197 [Populus tomentosa]|uniref:Uncharacterized protein n=1 Tax=Populus tomentosa TaxID=118781 RepID=A0A8X7ZFV7_POPTO|nr:hypothetical protein POTOM_027197 [Populus tomentosa]
MSRNYTKQGRETQKIKEKNPVPWLAIGLLRTHSLCIFVLFFLIFFVFSSIGRVSKADFELTGDVLAQQEADRVIRLPGLPEVTFKQYAVMEELCFIGFFYAIENPEEKPLLICLNGSD